MQRESTVCLITSANLAADPRLVKEASALRECGYRVRVVAADIMPSLARYDLEIAKQVADEFIRISYREPAWKKLGRAIRRRVAGKVSARLTEIPPRLAAAAHHPLTPGLTRAALQHPADLYIAHNLGALPAAGAAARRYNARLGFDAEDYHCGELPTTDMNAPELRVRRSIESYWLPKCAHLTSASPDISDAYQRDYHVKMQPILNVFPLSQAPAHPEMPQSWREKPPSLYWFSQTIGAGRGLEEIVGAIGLLRTPADLFLRGNSDAGFIDRLLATARSIGDERLTQYRIKILPVANPAEMVTSCAGYDLGLATEPSAPRNRDICLTNKAFTYLLAGVPVVLSQTTAQARLAADLGRAALLIDLSKPKEAASILDAFFTSKETQVRARKEAWRLGRERFNWDIEKRKFIESVERTLNSN
jgi:glycosyltransferase involved in cell wall biosynthesis